MAFTQIALAALIGMIVWSVSASFNPALAGNQQNPEPGIRGALQRAVLESESFRDRFEAEVWLMDMAQRLQKKIKKDHLRIELLKQVHYEANRVKLPPELILAVIHVESNFDAYAISSVGARGLMQVMPFWMKEIGRPNDDLFDMRTNLRYGSTILRYYLDMEKGNLSRALGRYNGSLKSYKYSDSVFRALRTQWHSQ